MSILAVFLFISESNWQRFNTRLPFAIIIENNKPVVIGVAYIFGGWKTEFEASVIS